MGQLKLRKVTTEDKLFLLNLANEEACRRNSISINYILEEEHEQWFKKKLASDDTDMYILVDENNNRIGQGRLDYNQNNVIISYSIIKEERGHGYGKELVSLLERKYRKEKKAKTFFAIVKDENAASKSIFLSLGYRETKKDVYIEYSKQIEQE